MKSSNPAFSFAEFGAGGEVVGVREKKPVSDCAVAGAYYFAAAKIFVDAAMDTIIYPSAKEYYMSDACNTLIAQGGKIGVHNIRAEDFSCVGTPKQLREYLKNNPQ